MPIIHTQTYTRNGKRVHMHMPTHGSKHTRQMQTHAHGCIVTHTLSICCTRHFFSLMSRTMSRCESVKLISLSLRIFISILVRSLPARDSLSVAWSKANPSNTGTACVTPSPAYVRKREGTRHGCCLVSARTCNIASSH